MYFTKSCKFSHTVTFPGLYPLIQFPLSLIISTVSFSNSLLSLCLVAATFPPEQPRKRRKSFPLTSNHSPYISHLSLTTHSPHAPPNWTDTCRQHTSPAYRDVHDSTWYSRTPYPCRTATPQSAHASPPPDPPAVPRGCRGRKQRCTRSVGGSHYRV
ncbi:hypothetical protein B0J12DRAFT_660415 [Macrophomina phaseolina]|uniref:Uncharacterized protein n=1 Tax=Macrophomina phaseolina TaxID=35725 RepID=A0ABQ8GD76_9PEZI|nr:hypothetical protein B0J12DRAFT_660415 [Macrophomina phaseolina]